MSFRIELEQTRALKAIEPDERLLTVREMVDRLAGNLGAATWGKRGFRIDFTKTANRAADSKDDSNSPLLLATWEIFKTRALVKSIIDGISNSAQAIIFETLSTTYKRQFYRLSLLERDDGSMFFRSNIGETEGPGEQDFKELLKRQFIQGPKTECFTEESHPDLLQ